MPFLILVFVFYCSLATLFFMLTETTLRWYHQKLTLIEQGNKCPTLFSYLKPIYLKRDSLRITPVLLAVNGVIVTLIVIYMASTGTVFFSMLIQGPIVKILIFLFVLSGYSYKMILPGFIERYVKDKEGRLALLLKDVEFGT